MPRPGPFRLLNGFYGFGMVLIAGVAVYTSGQCGRDQKDLFLKQLAERLRPAGDLIGGQDIQVHTPGTEVDQHLMQGFLHGYAASVSDLEDGGSTPEATRISRRVASRPSWSRLQPLGYER